MKITKAQLKQIIKEEIEANQYGLRPDQEARYELEADADRLIAPVAALYDTYRDDLDMTAFSEDIRRQFKTGGNPFGDLNFKAVIAVAHAYMAVRKPEGL